MLLLLATVTMMYGKEPGGVLHTIITKTSSIFETSISIRIRSEGTKRIVRVPVYSTETVEVGYKATDGKFYKKDGSTWDKLQQYYHYVDSQNTYIESENGIIELEEVGYYEGEVITKERTTKTGSYEDVELSSKVEINIIVISEKGAIKKILSFKDKYAIGNVTQKELNDWIEWLKSSNKTENELFSKLSQRVYITLKSENPYQGLYEEGGEYLRKYFNISYENKKFDSEKASALESKGKEIVEQNVSYSKNPIKNFLGMGNNNRGIIKEILRIENDYDSLLKIGEIVPDLKEVKAGDIVAFKENGNPETGIVINVTDKKEIAYINADVGYAKNYTIEDIKNKADGEAFIVIRILDEENQDIENASWNVLEDEIKDVKISVETMKESSQKSNEKHRWIPNTGESLELSNIRVTFKTTMGLEVVKDNIQVNLVGAIDRGYTDSPESGENGNIYKNTANKFEVKINEQIYFLERDINAPNKYNNLNIKLEINEQGYIEKDQIPLKIEIRPDVKQIYPGDDLLLLFKIGETEYTVAPEDYIAVYDKKMLWRANQYISETEARLQNLDWNDAHPWNTNESTISWYGTNDWLGDTDGGQIPIQGWTRFNDDEDVNGSVAYGWGCFDSIIAFNNELRAQSEGIKKYKEDNEKKTDKKYEIKWEESDLGVYAPTRTTSSQSQEEKLWENYIFPNISSVLKVEPKKLKDREETDLFISTETDLSVPGLSTYWYSLDMITGKYYKYDQAVRTSGVDCSGLAYISTQYGDSKYETNQFNTVDKPNAKNFNGNTSAWISGKTVTIRPLSYVIFNGAWDLNPAINNNTRPSIIENRDKQRKLLSYAVPGDILVTDSHVVIIQDLQYEGDNTVITDYSQVYVIHSASGELGAWQTWKVHKSKWSEIEVYDSEKIKYQLRRLTREVVLK